MNIFKSKFNKFFLAAIAFIIPNICAAAESMVKMNLTNDTHKYIGTILLQDTSYGLLLTPNLNDLSEGIHGFHIHLIPSCKKGGMDAGSHLDPADTNKHLGPYNEDGHLGDLPFLYVDKNGHAVSPILAPRLKLKDVKNHSIIIHAGGDNYSDNPKLGGGGARIACGIVN